MTPEIEYYKASYTSADTDKQQKHKILFLCHSAVWASHVISLWHANLREPSTPCLWCSECAELQQTGTFCEFLSKEPPKMADDSNKKGTNKWARTTAVTSTAYVIKLRVSPSFSEISHKPVCAIFHMPCAKLRNLAFIMRATSLSPDSMKPARNRGFSSRVGLPCQERRETCEPDTNWCEDDDNSIAINQCLWIRSISSDQ